MGSRFLTLRLISRTTSTSCGTGCPQGAIFLRRFAGRHSEGRWTDSAVGNSYGRRQNRPGGRQTVSGAPTGTDFPCGLLRIPTRQVGDRGPQEGSSAMLAVRLGARYRRQELFRQHRLGVAAQGGPQTYGLPLIVPLVMV